MTNTPHTPTGERAQETVQKAWIETFASRGLDTEYGETITRAVFADGQLLHESLEKEEIKEIVEEALDETDLQPYIEEYGEGDFTATDEQKLKEELLAKLEAGLDGELYGPSFADREIALDGPSEHLTNPSLEEPDETASADDPDGSSDADTAPSAAAPGTFGSGEEDIDEDQSFTGKPTVAGTESPETTEGPDTISDASLSEPAAGANMEFSSHASDKSSEDTAPDEEPDEIQMAFNALARLLNDTTPEVRVSAIQALGDIGATHTALATDVITILLDATDDDNQAVRQASAKALGQVTTEYSEYVRSKSRNETDMEPK